MERTKSQLNGRKEGEDRAENSSEVASAGAQEVTEGPSDAV